jgi:murein DD-endopeptidase MepM/ murein hydrolase activator NlpD
MPFYIKKTLFQFLSAVLSGLRFCGGLILGFFSSFLQSVKDADYFILKNILAPFYKLIWRSKRKVREMSGTGEVGGGFALFAYCSILVLFVVVGTFLSWTSVINAGVSDEILEKKPLVFAIASEGGGEEELILEKQGDGGTITNSPVSYLNEVPVLASSDVSAGIPIDCDNCEEVSTTLDESTLLPPNMALVESKDGSKIRREIEEYIVLKGDNLASIAKEFALNVNTLLWANNLYSWSTLKVGQKLIIPPIDGVLHTILKGESLDKIAKQYKIDKTQILAYNDVDEEQVLTVGTYLLIPGAKKQTVVTPSAPKVVLIPSKIVGSLGLVWPASTKRITQYYSWRHQAIDIGAPMGTPIYAISDGVIEYSGWGTGYGWEIIINHGNGMRTRYAHASKLLVQKGMHVEKGQVIALIGSTGWSTGPHLHFELYYNNQRVNPLQYLK